MVPAATRGPWGAATCGSWGAAQPGAGPEGLGWALASAAEAGAPAADALGPPAAGLSPSGVGGTKLLRLKTAGDRAARAPPAAGEPPRRAPSPALTEAETCPISTEGGTRRVQLVREGGGRGAAQAEQRAAAQQAALLGAHARRRIVAYSWLSRQGTGGRGGGGAGGAGASPLRPGAQRQASVREPPPPPPAVLTGHVSSLLPY